MGEKIGLWLQNNLVILSEDDTAPEWFLSGIGINDLTENDRWQLCVEMIYRLLVSGIIVNDETWCESVGVMNHEQYAEVLSKFNPFDSKELTSGIMPWVAPLLYGSNNCLELLRKHGLNDTSDLLNEALIEDIEMLFKQHGVSWGGAPLYPVRQVK